MHYPQSYRAVRSLGRLVRKKEDKEARTRSDRAIAERLRQALEQVDLPDVASISVYVRDGRVTIQGIVTSVQELRFISDVARRVEGVRQVITHIQIVSRDEIRALEEA